MVHVPLSATSRILSATSDGCAGVFSELLKSAANLSLCRYGDVVSLTVMRRAIAVSMIPGSTSATRTLKVFISPASPSVSASSAHFVAQYDVSGAQDIFPATELMLMMHPLLRSRICATTAW